MRSLGGFCLAALLTVFAFTAAAENRMHLEASPYLRLHADDLVHWRPWSRRTLEQARRQGKPIFLSIGYLSCHWCHVMRRESFTDPRTAALINRLFFPILIDREEMPAVDASFQAAASLMGLASGWPLNLLLTPDGKPFWGGAYFPKTETGGVPAFATLLKGMERVFRERPDAVRGNAETVTAALEALARPRPGSLSPDDLDAAAEAFAGQVDPFSGGFGDAPLFPMTVAQAFLWRSHIRTGDGRFRQAVTTALEGMARGGIFDHVGGGFFRYAVDPHWNVPHFEKMLNTNAALLNLMAEVWRETGDPLLKDRADKTAGFLLRELRLEGGAFAAALDADSRLAHQSGEEEEGAYYLWRPDGLEAVLGGDAALLMRAYGLSPPDTGDPDGAGVLHRNHVPLDDIAAAGGGQDVLDAALARLFRARLERPRPRRDDKVLADWNGLAIAALTEAGLAFGEPDWIAAAARAFAFIDENLGDGTGRLSHSLAAGKRGQAAGLNDLAAMADAALALHQATGERRYLDKAQAWTEQAMTELWDRDGTGFFATAENAAPQLVRAKPIHDDTEAAGNARMIDVLARLHYLTGDETYRQRADITLKAFAGFAEPPEPAVAGLLNAAETLRAALQIVVIGRRGSPAADALLRQVAAISLPNKVLQVVAPGEPLPGGHPAHGKEQIDGRATAYVCRGTFCSLPVNERESLAETLLSLRKRSP